MPAGCILTASLRVRGYRLAMDDPDETTAQARSDERTVSRRDRAMEAIFWGLLCIGVIPFVGLLTGASPSPAQLGIAVLSIIGAVAGIIAERRQRRRERPRSHPRRR